MSIAWVTCVVAYATLLARLYWLGLCGRYPFLSTYLLVTILTDLLLGWFPTHNSLWLNNHSAIYAKCWAGCAVIVSIFRLMAVYEVFEGASRHQADFVVIKWRLAWTFVLAAALLCTFPLPAEYFAGAYGAPWLKVVFVVSRYLDSLYAIFLVLGFAFFVLLIERWVGAIQYQRNLLYNWMGLMSYTAIRVAMLLAVIFDRWNSDTYSLVMLWSTSAILAVWAIGLSGQTGEAWGRAPTPTEQERLLVESRYRAVQKFILGR